MTPMSRSGLFDGAERKKREMGVLETYLLPTHQWNCDNRSILALGTVFGVKLVAGGHLGIMNAPRAISVAYRAFGLKWGI